MPAPLRVAHEVTYECARSERTYRRWARRTGSTASTGSTSGRDALLTGRVAAGTVEQPSRAAYSYYPGALVARERTLANRIGLAAVLAVAPTTQQRKEVIEVAIAQLAPDTIVGICEDYPQELVWAVRPQGRTDFLPIIMDMVDD